MKWTARFFDTKATEWQARAADPANIAKGRGYIAYAKRQGRMWGLFRAHAVDVQRYLPD